MNTEQAGRVRALAEEYVSLVEAMRGGAYADGDEWRQLSGQRTLVHDELIALTGLTERNQMYAYCRQLLSTPDLDPAAYEDLLE